MPSENYRYYCLDGVGDLHNSESFHAESDEDAVARVKAKHPEGKCEVWEDQRLVAQIGFQRRDDVISQSVRNLADCRRVLMETAHLVRPPSSPAGEGDAR